MLDYWIKLLEPGVRWLVPEKYPLYGQVPINRPVFDFNVANEDLLGLLPPVDDYGFEKFAPTVWDELAYKKSFEKFEYSEPADFLKDYGSIVEFADRMFIRHFSFLQDTRVINIMATEKNLNSIPAYPKMLWYDTEEDFLEEHGWSPYVDEFNNIVSGDRPSVCWYLFLKKEIQSCSKIDEGDIRQIVCSDPIYCRIGACFEQQQNQLMKCHTELSSGQCGWSPFFGGWLHRVNRLQKGEKNVFLEMDWTRFDGTIPRDLFLHIKKLRWSFIHDDDRDRYAKAYQWYCQNLIDRFVILPSGEVTYQGRGNPSGQISTTMDNNMINYWLQAFEFKYLGLPEEEWDHFDTIIYGDDRISVYKSLPCDYGPRIVSMYKEIFGMWVKPEKIKVSNTIYGLTFCGFKFTPSGPVPAEPYKLMASLLKPVSKLPDIEALHGKLLCFQLLMANDTQHPFYKYIERCLACTYKALSDANLPRRFTRSQLEYIWRGGPNDDG
uniref:Non-structural polyprotein 1AB n=1 Tax=Macaque MLB-like astrovirus TaxID=2796356 RepID=A0A8E0KL57_9VIRU|nr:TPA: ORF1b protein [Macaque MLB-like astrovirus]